jgi:hypothetical protein
MPAIELIVKLEGKKKKKKQQEPKQRAMDWCLPNTQQDLNGKLLLP